METPYTCGPPTPRLMVYGSIVVVPLALVVTASVVAPGVKAELGLVHRILGLDIRVLCLAQVFRRTACSMRFG